MEKQIYLSHQALVLQDRNRHNGFEAGIAAMVHSRGLSGLNRDDAYARRRCWRAAEAFSRLDALLTADHGGGQPF
ncbi:MAG TPA: hypothetical protein VIK97_09660 [Casimicrobiaceae bacterium]